MCIYLGRFVVLDVIVCSGLLFGDVGCFWMLLFVLVDCFWMSCFGRFLCYLLAHSVQKGEK